MKCQVCGEKMEELVTELVDGTSITGYICMNCEPEHLDIELTEGANDG